MLPDLPQNLLTRPGSATQKPALCFGFCVPAGGVNTLMKIRAYKENDKDEVISLWYECGLVAPQYDTAKDIERKQKVDPDLFLIGYNGNEVVASVMSGYQGHGGWIN
jgi:hypothetical protein